MDEIEGFRLYLSVAEGDELELAGAPRKTPGLYETYLPFALALGVSQAWSEQFANVFRTQAAAGVFAGLVSAATASTRTTSAGSRRRCRTRSTPRCLRRRLLRAIPPAAAAERGRIVGRREEAAAVADGNADLKKLRRVRARHRAN